MNRTVPAAVDVMEGFTEYFDDLEDPRLESRINHPLLEVLMIAILGTICGAEGWADLAAFAKSKQEFLGTFLELKKGVPRKDCFRRVFGAISPYAFQQCFLRWITALVGTLEGKHLAVDGKTLRAALAHRDVPALHMVHAWVVDNQVLFGQLPGEGKGQELETLPQLLAMLDIRGATVTIDALGCQKEIAKQITDQGANYLLSVKDNQPTLHQELGQYLLDAQAVDEADDHARTEERGHGRYEVREAWVMNDVSDCPIASSWPNAQSAVLIQRTRTRGDETEVTTHVYLSNEKDLTAVRAMHLVRRHWSVENQLHWTLDVAMREDQCRIHDANGAQNFALVRRVGINALKRERSEKRGVRLKQKICGWDHQYLLSILQLMSPIDVV